MNIRPILFLLGPLVLATQLAACGPPAPKYEEPVRMVKLVAASPADAGTYRFIALVRRARRAELSFESGGRLASVTADIGDTVRRGQVLATIDDEPARLQIEQAQAQLRSAAGQLRERREQYRQQRAMHDDGATSLLTLNSAETALATAEAAHQSAVAALRMATRAANNAAVRAPYEGRITARLLEPGTMAGAGQAVLRMEGGGDTQVVADLPVDLIPPSLKVGAVVAARPGGRQQGADEARNDEALQLKLKSIADHVDAGGTVQAIFDLPPGSTSPRSGEALAIAINAGMPATLMVPLTAVAQGASAGKGHVFVYHFASKSVERRPVVLGELRGDSVEIVQGLRAGEQVAAAGTAFLIDHQRVLAYTGASALAAGEPR